MKIPRHHGQTTEQVAVILQAPADQMLHTLGALDLRHHTEQLRTQQDLALTFGKVCPDQQIESTTLVFQGNEDRPPVTRTLTDQHQACGTQSTIRQGR